MKPPKCRLFVIPARDEPVAVILRRGPTQWYHLILWNTRDDTFEHGAWIRGRIYEEKCDVSPDGQLFVYSVLQGRRYRTEYQGCWTAVSRPPWLHALALWPQGTTYYGGGRFVGNHDLVLRTIFTESHPQHLPIGIKLVGGDSQLHRSSDEVPGADWSGHDHQDRLIYTIAGKLFRRKRGKDLELSDFSDLKPDPQPAPEWATRPLIGAIGSTKRQRLKKERKANRPRK